MLQIDVRSMWIDTFHSLCNQLLRTHFLDAGLPESFQVLDEENQVHFAKRLLKSLNVDDEKFSPQELCNFINTQKELGLRPAAVEAYDNWARTRVGLYEAYEAQCKREGVVDFAELLLRSFETLELNEPLRRHYQDRFKHILVDEFQDTSRLQYRWLKLLAGGGAQLFCVGDDDQSIYAFRGADVGNMADFEREFNVSNLIRLKQNYRSHSNIIDAANAIIKNNPSHLGNSLWTEAGSGELIRIHESPSDGDEARWIVMEIESLLSAGHAPAEIVVLYRIHEQSWVLERALRNASLPYRVYGGLRLFKRVEVKQALAYLRLIADPGDDASFACVVNFPPRGIGVRSLGKLRDAATASKCSLHAAIRKVAGEEGAELATFAQVIATLRDAAHLPLPELVHQVVELSGLRAHYQNEKEGQERLANLDELINTAAGFVAEEWTPDPNDGINSQIGHALSSFLAHASLEAGEHQSGEGGDAVQLMTAHSAKGLEFNVVFISGLEDGLFPHENSLYETQEGKSGLEEERRLMYVAVTRARQRLYLSFAQTRMLHGQTRYNLPSRFLDEIPKQLAKWLTPRACVDSFAEPPAPTFGNAPRRSDPDGGGFCIGRSVRHAKFGLGVILNTEGDGTDARVQVNFGNAGIKWLALSVAKLEPA
jgi:DNA helicase-2/ATP-dependent DNA helicase PcrA